MKIKRYFAADMRQAIKMVRDEQGIDAVILSNRKVEGGVEIVAAVDYDEALVRRMAARSAAPPPADPPPAAVAAPPTPTSRPFVPPPVAGRAGELELPPELASEPAPRPTAAPSKGLFRRRQEAPSAPPPPAPAPAAEPATVKIEWSQDPVLSAMHSEIKTLRSILEGQFTTLAWGEQKRRHPLQTRLLEQLTRLGLSTGLCHALLERVKEVDDPQLKWRQALGYLARNVRVTEDDILNRGGIVSLVGPTGVGKTTTVAKLAARYTLRHGHGRVALLTTDSYRIGAHQQLKTYGRILGAPVHVAADASELRRIVDNEYDKGLILIDTAGMSQRDLRLTEQFAMLRDGSPLVRNYLVLSASTQRVALDETVRAFSHIDITAAILTKLDETVGLGEVLSVLVQKRLPVAYVSEGQRVPEDLAPARANTLVSKSVALMQRYAPRPDDDTMALAFRGMVSNGL